MTGSGGVSGIAIRPARADEAEEISELALRSKGYWGYSPAFLEACREELTVTRAQCASGSLFVADDDGRIVGYVRIAGSPPEGQLEALFVEPERIGTGLGRQLLRFGLSFAAARGFRRLDLAADPGAESFYAKHGAVTTGTVASGSIPGRSLPHMRFDLAGT